ncbi:MAG: LysM peptidoglycan-binding domain-containing protein [Candidatus Binatia bacterium]
MRIRTRAVFGLAVFLSAMTGCAVTRYPGSDGGVSRPPLIRQLFTPYRQYGWSVDPSSQALFPAYDAPAAESEQPFDFSHPQVDRYVTRFQTDLRGFFSHALSRSYRYVPQMSAMLKQEGLPEELAYLPLIESGFRPLAVSWAGAVGPWQLMRGTGRRYGLRIDRYVDERRDPVKSTQAAAEYLKDLYAMFGDWHLSLAAYNTGEGNIIRILEKGRAADFWEMSDRGYLHRETRDFVPRFLAALEIAEAPQAYGFDVPDPQPWRYETMRIMRPLSLARVARLSGTSIRTIKELNPALRRGVVPRRGYAVRLPEGTKTTFRVAYAKMTRKRMQARTRRSGHHRSRLLAHGEYRVRRGETIISIAKAHHVPPRALMSINHIRNPRRLQAGQVLRVPRRGEGVGALAAARTSRRGARTRPVARRQHRVRRGETVASIARAHRVSVKSLLKLNHIRNPRRLQIGQVLQVSAAALPGTVLAARPKRASQMVD